jgi:hypothetical protein
MESEHPLEGSWAAKCGGPQRSLGKALDCYNLEANREIIQLYYILNILHLMLTYFTFNINFILNI